MASATPFLFMSKPKQVIKRLEPVHVERFEVRDPKMGVHVIAFHKVGTGRVPGFSHRVSLNGEATSKWLALPFKPNRKAAKFFFDKLKEDGLVKG